ncbi:MAG: DUF362 domain-containing protein [Deltaproteobacteria bacterium]|nr:DUF362 domain-containing protein [Deltaproteobacteria bacterium]
MSPKVAIIKKDNIPPIRSDYTKEEVEIIQGMLQESLGLLGGIEKFVPKGSMVVIKPNCVFGETPEVACNTDPRVVEALINIVNTVEPKKVIISEWMRAAGSALFEISGMNKAAVNTGAEVRASEDDPLVELDIPDAIGLLSSKGVPLLKQKVPKTYVEADVLINVPKMKTHLTTVATLSLKNLLGIPPCIGPDSYLDYHNDNIHQAIVEYYKLLKPALNIIDGLVAMEGQAPYLSLDVIKDMNVLIVGSDGVAVDAVSSAVMGIHPYEVATTRLSSLQGLGEADIDNIEVVGRKIEEVRRYFKRALPDVIGYKRHDGLGYPLEVYTGGTCVPGCYCMTREACDILALATHKYKIPPEKQRKLYIILGMQAKIPENFVEKAKRENAVVYVIGDCAAEHQWIAEEMGASGKFYGGCCCDWAPLYREICPDCIGRLSIEKGEGLISWRYSTS